MARSKYTMVERRGAVEVAAAAEGDEPKVIRGTVSSDEPVPGKLHAREVLSHEKGAVRLDRANAEGLPMRAEHEGLPVGRAFDFELVNGTLRTNRIELAPSHEHLRADIDGGFLRELSIRAKVLRKNWIERGSDLVATAWEPVEVAFTGLGADARAQIARNGGEDMSESDGGGNVVQRAEAIGAIFKGLDGEQWMQRHIDALGSDKSVEDIRADVLAELKRGADSAPRIPAGHVQAGKDGLDKFLGEVERTLAYRTGNMDGDEREKFERSMWGSEVAGLTLREMGRETDRRLRDRFPGVPIFVAVLANGNRVSWAGVWPWTPGEVIMPAGTDSPRITFFWIAPTSMA